MHRCRARQGRAYNDTYQVDSQPISVSGENKKRTAVINPSSPCPIHFCGSLSTFFLSLATIRKRVLENLTPVRWLTSRLSRTQSRRNRHGMACAFVEDTSQATRNSQLKLTQEPRMTELRTLDMYARYPAGWAEPRAERERDSRATNPLAAGANPSDKNNDISARLAVRNPCQTTYMGLAHHISLASALWREDGGTGGFRIAKR